MAKNNQNQKWQKIINFFSSSYAYVGLSSLIALIVVLLFGGLALGICGYSKDASPSNRSKTATCGGHCLMA